MICIDGVWFVRLADACLYIDVTCYRCKRLVALASSMEIDGRKYCHRCSEVIDDKPRTADRTCVCGASGF